MDASPPLVDLTPGSGAGPAAVAETHISVVFFAGSRAYKVCKAVDLGFVDYSTPQRRRAALDRELRVNRRFAPDVYLGLLDLVDEAGAVHDHVLVMRRMPADRRLTRLLDGPEAAQHLRAVAKEVAAIHASAPRPAAAAEAAGHAMVERNWVDNEAAMAPFVDAVLDPATFAAVGRGFRRYLPGRRMLFDSRIAGGHAVDGHGDLLAEDIFCLDDGPRILDCLAFDDRLRYGDVLADIAFLAMDVERLAGATLAGELLAWYDEFSGEHHPASLAHHYVAYRAQVRAKVACLRTSQGDGRAATDAATHLALCAAHLQEAQVRFVLVGGTPGTGKSTLAAGLADATGWSVLRSDELRKELAGLSPAEDARADFQEGLYRPETVAATYDQLRRQAGLLAEMGESVILDASWGDEHQRALTRQLAEQRVAADLVELRADAPFTVAAARIDARRTAGGDPSDATVEVAAELGRRFHPWPQATVIDTTRPVAACVRDARAGL